MNNFTLSTFILFFAISFSAMAGPQFITYEGYITDSSNIPLTGSYGFRFTVKDPTGVCPLYVERRTISALSGNFTAQVGAAGGTVDFNSVGIDFSKLFSNASPLTTQSGCSGAYNPTANDVRILSVELFDTIDSAYHVISTLSLGGVPFSHNAEKLAGIDSNHFLQFNVATTPLLSADYAELVNLLSGASTRYVQPSSNATFTSTITFSNAPQYSGTPISANDLTNKTYVDNAVSAALPNVGTSGTYFKVSTDAKGRVTSGVSNLVATDIPNLDAAKITTGSFSTPGIVSGSAMTSGTIGGSASINSIGNLVTTGTVSGGIVQATTLKIFNGANNVQITAPVLGSNIAFVLPNSVGTVGQVLKTDGSGNLGWVSAAGGSVTSVTAVPPLASSGGATPGLSMTQANTTTAGYVISADWNTFNNKLGAATTFVGDISGVYSATSVDKIKGTGVAITALAVGNFLKFDGTNWINTNLVLADITAGLGFTPLKKTGDTMTGLLVLSADPAANLGASTKQYVDAVTTASAAAYIHKDGTVAFTAAQSMGSNKLTFVTDPSSAQDAATKNYADTKLITKTLPIAPSGAQDGQSLRWNNGALAWEYYTPITGSGLTSLNGAIGTSQGFANGSSGTAPAFVTGSNVHTLNIPMAGTVSVTAGLISKTEYDTFNNKLSAATTFVGDISGVYSATSVDKIKGTGVAITTLASGNFLKYNGTNWVNSSLSSGDIIGGLGFTPVNKNGDNMTGLLVLSADPAASLGASTKQYVDLSVATAAANYIKKDGTVSFTSPQSMGSNKLTFVTDPTSAQDAATKNYADTKFITKTLPLAPGAAQAGQSLRWNNGMASWEYYSAGAGDFRSDGAIPMTGAFLASDGTAAAPGISFSSDTNTGIYHPSASNFAVTINGTERMRVNNVGYVGIGTTAPQALLHLSSGNLDNIYFDSYSTSNNPAFMGRRARGTAAAPQGVLTDDVLAAFGGRGYDGAIFSIDSRGSYKVFAAENWTSSAQGAYSAFATTSLGASSSVERMRIDAAGNVGIGTTVPSAKFEVRGVSSTVSDYAANFQNSAGSSILSIRDDGRVGIGTTAPAALLDVGNNGTLTAASFANNSIGNSTGIFTNSNPNGIAIQAAGKVFLGNSGTLISNMGVCTIASVIPTTSVSTYTCTTGSLPATTSIAVSCSATSAFTTPSSTVIYARSTGAGSQLAVNLSTSNSNSVTLICMWMQP